MLEWEDNFTSFKNKDPAIIEPEREPFFSQDSAVSRSKRDSTVRKSTTPKSHTWSYTAIQMRLDEHTSMMLKSAIQDRRT